jgi:hypothetical protein
MLLVVLGESALDESVLAEVALRESTETSDRRVPERRQWRGTETGD